MPDLLNLVDKPVRDRWKQLRTWFVTGLVALGPFALTLWIVIQLFLFMDSFLGRPIQWLLANLIGIEYFETHMIHGIGFIVLIALILAAGWFTRQYLGVKIVEIVNKLFEHIPLVNKVYIAVVQISQALLGGQKEVFKHAVIVEYPRKGIWSIGFLTQDTRGAVQESLALDVISVFLPTTPNPTSGYLLFVPKKDVVLLEVSVEEALKLVISAGAIIPKKSAANTQEIARLMGIRYRPFSYQDGDE